MPALDELATACSTASVVAAQHELVGRVDVGEHDVAVDLLDDPLDLLDRRRDGGQRPGSSTVRLAISRPRALTASSAAANVRTPAATSAPYSPSEWPMTRSGSMP